MINLNNCKSVDVTHRHTGEIRTFYVNNDGTEIYAAHKSTGEMRLLGQSETQFGYKKVNFNSDKKMHTLYVSMLVWATWVNDGEFLMSNGFDIDHIDDNNQNNSFTNLQRIPKKENLKKMWKKQNRLCANCKEVL